MATCGNESLEITSDDMQNADTESKPAKTMVEDDFSTQTWKEDLEIKLDDKQIFVSSGVLVSFSPVFSSMLESLMKNKEPTEPRILELPGKNHVEFVEFLRCLFFAKEVSVENVYIVLPNAYDYGVSFLVNKCEQVLIERIEPFGPASNADILSYLTLARKYQLKKLETTCSESILSMSDHDLQEAEKDFPLPLDIKVEVQNSRCSELHEKVAKLSEKLNSTLIKSDQYEKIVKSFWVGDLRGLDMPDAEMGILEFDIQNTRQTRWSPAIKINDKTIKIKLMSEVNLFERIFISFYIYVSVPKKYHMWSCNVRAKLRILNQKKGNEHRCVEKKFTFTEDKSTQILASIDTSTLLGGNTTFTKDDKLYNEVFLLVDSTVHQTKRSNASLV